MSKLSVGVYGDSYANMNLDKEGTFSWIDQLKTKYAVTNHGECGNSVYQCYKKYLECRDNYDYNIFIIPAIHRFFSSHLFNLLADQQKFRNWFLNPDGVQLAKAQLLKQMDTNNYKEKLKIIESVELAMMHWIDYDYVTETNYALVDKIKNDKNIILIDTNSDNHKIGLTEISFWELEQVGYKEQYLDKGSRLNAVNEEKNAVVEDIRANHFSEENNLALGNIILAAIDSNFSGEIMMSVNMFVKPSKTLDSYLRWRNL